jgi:phosphatidylglycerol lysyltransferase
VSKSEKKSNILAKFSIQKIAPANFFAILILLNGLIITIETLTQRYRARFDIFYQIFPVEIYYYHRLISAVIGISLVYLSINLFAKKRLAYLITLGLLFIDALLDFNLYHITLGAVFSITLFFILFFRSKDFPVKSEPAYINRGLIIFATGIIFALFYGTFGFWLLDKRDFAIDFSISESFIRTTKAFTLIGNSDLLPRTRNATWFLDSLSVIGFTSIVVGIYNLFRPLAYILKTQPQERNEVRQIVEKYGKSDMDFFKTASDKSYFFSPNRQSVIAYKTVRGIALALGDPVGPKDQLPNLIKEFVSWCATLGWRTVFISVSEELLPVYKDAGLKGTKIGEEAIINLNYFLENTIKKKDYRRVLKKFDDLGFQAKFQDPPQTQELLNSLYKVNVSWLTVEGRREMAFALGRFEHNYIANSPIFYIENPQGEIIAFVNEIPAYEKGMANIDLMRHKNEIPNGMMDYLFAKYFINLSKRGFEKFNLGLAPLAGYSPAKDSYGEQLVYQLINYLDRFFSFSGLRAYKQKFDPVWRSGYLIYQGTPVALVPIALAIQKALEA